MDDASGFEVRRARWREGRVVGDPVPAPVADGQVCLRVDRFALTSNNVTYAVVGDLLGYWTFFPAGEGWGRVPAMGFADVIASRHPDVAVGERVFGFFPMATHLRVEAGDVGRGHFVDTAAHRQATALPYRQYLPCAADALYDPAREDVILLFRGLFLTSFLVDDFLADNRGFDARTIVVSSASSKTAIALAHLLAARGAGHVIGLTSARNADFVRGLGCYGQVALYDDAATLPTGGRVAFVDHSGDAAVVREVHERFGDDLVYSGIVGATHWDRRGRTGDLPGAAPAFFFAPAQLEKRTAEWGADGLQARLGAAWQRFVAFTDRWLRVERGHGPEAVQATWEALVDGRAAPDVGHVVSMWPQ